MNSFQWLCAIFGVVFGVTVVGLIVLDVYLDRTNQDTISRHIANFIQNSPVSGALFACSLGLAVGFCVGALACHLFGFTETPGN